MVGRKPNAGHFQKGNRLGGRPVGSRNRFSEHFLADLAEHWAVHGKAALDRVAVEKPHVYCQLACSLVPRQLNVEKFNPLGDWTDEELRRVMEHVAADRARLVREIEQINGAAMIEASPVATPFPFEPEPEKS